MGFGPQIANSAAAKPEGLLLHENLVHSLFPMHIGMRQYWRDLDTLLAWTRSEPHRTWWNNFLRDSGFWHETYLMRGGMEAVYDDLPKPIGMMHFALIRPARGSMFGSAQRAGHSHTGDAVVSETELYD
jgi:hypothetical protein